MITKRTKVMLGVLVVVAIGAYAYLYWWSRTPDHGFFDNLPAIQHASDKASKAVIRPQQTTTTPAVPGQQPVTPASATYSTYTSGEFNFSFEYPDNWSVSATVKNGRTELCLNVKDGIGDCLATVALEKESVNASAEKSLDALRADYRAGTIDDSTRRIGGEEATLLRVSKYPAGEMGDTRAAVFVNDTHVFTITAAAGQEAVFDRIASSFTFKD